MNKLLKIIKCILLKDDCQDGSSLSSIFISGVNNKVILYDENTEIILTEKDRIKNLKLEIFGNNNVVKIHSSVKFDGVCAIGIGGNHNEFIIGKTRFSLTNFSVNYMYNDSHRKINIGENFSASKTSILIRGDGKSIIIGNNCMFSWNTEIMNGDYHNIYDENKKLISFNSDKKIGNNVWINGNTIILKNANIQDGCIIGAGSVVTKTFKEKNAVIAGNPAKVVKRNIRWER